MALNKLHKHLSELVAIPSVTSDKQVCSQAIEYVKRCLPAQFKANTVSSNDVTSLLVTHADLGVGEQPKIWLAAHLDVVPAPRELFSLRQDGDKLIGRGTYDMKFAAVAYLRLLDEHASQLEPNGVGLVFTCDEEVGGFDGMGYLAEQGIIDGEVMILPDGGTDWAIEQRAKGIGFYEVTAAGKAAHGSRPWEGDNAATRLLRAVDNIHTRSTNAFVAKDDFYTTATLTKLEAGQASNAVPAEAKATYDVRFVTESDVGVFEEILDVACNVDALSWKRTVGASVFSVDTKHPRVAQFAQVVHEVTGRDAGFCDSHGGSDARFFADRADFSVILTRPEGGGMHGDDEWISAKGLDQFYLVLEKFVLNYKG